MKKEEEEEEEEQKKKKKKKNWWIVCSIIYDWSGEIKKVKINDASSTHDWSL